MEIKVVDFLIFSISKPCLFMHAVLRKTFVKISGVHSVFVYDFPRFRFTENHTPQAQFRCVMVCYCSQMPQKTSHACDTMVRLPVPFSGGPAAS